MVDYAFIIALRRLGLKDCHNFLANLVYTVNPRLVWETVSLIEKKQENKMQMSIRSRDTHELQSIQSKDKLSNLSHRGFFPFLLHYNHFVSDSLLHWVRAQPPFFLLSWASGFAPILSLPYSELWQSIGMACWGLRSAGLNWLVAVFHNIPWKSLSHS